MSEETIFADMDQIIVVGFGVARLCKDGEQMIDGDKRYEEGRPLRFSEAESMASQDPNHEWTVEIRGPMYGVIYRRVDSFKWKATHKDEGFA